MCLEERQAGKLEESGDLRNQRGAKAAELSGGVCPWTR